MLSLKNIKNFLDMCKKNQIICSAKLNAIVANDKIHEHIENFIKDNPDGLSGATIEKGVHLVKVITNGPAFGHPAGVPFFAFAKNVGQFSVINDLKSGHTQMFDGASLRSVSRVKGRFTINGVVYALKDTMNDMPRYRAVARPEKKSSKQSFRRELAAELAV